MGTLMDWKPPYIGKCSLGASNIDFAGTEYVQFMWMHFRLDKLLTSLAIYVQQRASTSFAHLYPNVIDIN